MEGPFILITRIKSKLSQEVISIMEINQLSSTVYGFEVSVTEFEQRRFWATGSEPFSPLICLDAAKFIVLKCFYSYRDDLPKKLLKITAEECKKSTTGWLSSLKNVVIDKEAGCTESGFARSWKVLEFYRKPLIKKSLKSIFPWKVLKFSSTLNAVAWKVCFMLFVCPRQNINHSSEKLKVIYMKCFLMQELTIDLRQMKRKM